MTVQGSMFNVQGSEFWVLGSEFRVLSSWFVDLTGFVPACLRWRKAQQAGLPDGKGRLEPVRS